MSVRVSSDFDGGNAEVIDASSPSDIRLRIRKDAGDKFLQWFHFRVSGADAPIVVRIENAGEVTYRRGFVDYRAVASTDRRDWYRIDTSFEDGVLELRHAPADAVWFAYFAPYSMQRHHNQVARWAADPRVSLEVLGATLEGQDLDCLHVGEGPLSVWCLARQHPGETMAEHWMDGFLERLTDPDEPVARHLLQRATLHVVPNMNPDGSRRGFLRTNASGANLNREWLEPTMERSPEVYLVRERMRQTGVDLCLDVHGDEELPYVFIAGSDGIPSLTEHQKGLLTTFKRELARITPDFQTEHGYPPAAPGEANLRMCTNWVAETFGCLAMTLEMPFRDANNHPLPRTGWSPARSAHLGRACLAAISAVAGDLRHEVDSAR